MATGSIPGEQDRLQLSELVAGQVPFASLQERQQTRTLSAPKLPPRLISTSWSALGLDVVSRSAKLD
jgi:hypothetical protein